MCMMAVKPSTRDSEHMTDVLEKRGTTINTPNPLIYWTRTALLRSFSIAAPQAARFCGRQEEKENDFEHLYILHAPDVPKLIMFTLRTP